MHPDFFSLPSRDDEGAFHVVVETPRGSRVKLAYRASLGAFALGRPLPLGLAYPYDWGFVPGTRAPDGDPVDAIVLLDAPTHPGVVIACRPLAVVEVEQNAKQGTGRQRNDRIVAEPTALRRPASPLTPRVREELAAFFTAVTAFEGKDVRILGWGEPAAADALIDRCRHRAP